MSGSPARTAARQPLRQSKHPTNTLASDPPAWHLQSGSGFSCQFDGVDGLQHCNPDSLHATGPPPKDKELQPFQAKPLAESLPVEELQGWLAGYQEDPPCDLRRGKPDSGLWCDVLVGQRSIDSLPDDDLQRLSYVASREFQLLGRASAKVQGTAGLHLSHHAAKCCACIC